MQYTHQDQTVTAISEGFAGLQLRRSSTTVTTSSNGPGDINDHISELRAEIEKMTTAISNPWVKAGLQMGMDKAVQDLVASFKANAIQRRPSEIIPVADPKDPQRDIEKGTPTTMPPLLRKRSKRRYLLGTYTSITNTPFGALYFINRKYKVKVGSSETLRSDGDHYEYESHFVLHPAQWLLRWGVSFGVDMAITKSIHGWKNNIRTFRAVPDNSLIFDFCKTGNTMGVKSLLARGDASPWDTNSLGWTPLHVSLSLRLSSLHLELKLIKVSLSSHPGIVILNSVSCY
jgi:hypothetical protein